MTLLKKIGLKPSRLVKRGAAILTPFLILLGSGIIVNLLLLKNAFDSIEFLSVSSSTPIFYIFILAFLTFLIYELNRKLQNSGAAIGLLLAIVISLPIILFQFIYVLPVSITVWNVINNLFSLTLASYVFNVMWG
ncbi:hypothetical protein HN592_02170 [Candidatus Woesearchaeota archaeon]|jgi:hypothetical protein|nr:hypothetical protein [Candidatus Woesearchaeota archaeon]MBT4368018.1 hypothetical protein [Candidatus Woesearchaeota archaeon]MBT4712506.1 hypothetical protein [Candidatus Woesearchaeota archaeon]MBT6639419.1 hypothetical protein [Candidatus Woesearchaeota archaeon]MBT7133591.1 hypothetical protein [Candidatus Woesearchaeota archaeon]